MIFSHDLQEHNLYIYYFEIILTNLTLKKSTGNVNKRLTYCYYFRFHITSLLPFLSVYHNGLKMGKNCVLFSDLSPFFFLRNWERGYLDYLERASYPRQFYLDYITTISSILTKFCRIDQRKKCQSSHYSKWRNYFKWWHNVWRRTYNWSCRWPRDRPSPSTGQI